MKLQKYEDVVKAVDKHTSDEGRLDEDITCILEEVPTACEADTRVVMGKGLIVIDIPDNCGGCRFFRQFTGFAQTCSYYNCDTDARIKPSWCPIHPFPKRKYNIDPLYENDEWCDGYNSGWNACVDEVMEGDITE